jgi:cytochrome P450
LIFITRSIPVFFSHLFEGGAFGDDPEWPNQYRKVITSGLWKVNQLDVFENAIGNSINTFLEKNLTKYASSGEWFDLTPELHKCVALVNLRVFLGEEAVQTHGAVWQYRFPELDKLSVDQLVGQAPKLPFGKPKRFQEVKAEIFKLMDDAWETVLESTRDKYDRDAKSPLFDCYGELLAYGWENRLSTRTVTAHMLGMLFAAHVNTASSLLWSTALISKRPEYVEKIRKEADGETQKRLGDESTGIAGNFSFACIREAARVYPILATMRIAMQDMQIPGTNYWAKKGDMISATPLSVHFDPKYFPEPEAFKPERFGDEEANKTISSNLAYIGFGSGGHTCLGERFVLRIGRKWLQGLFSRYEVEIQNEKLPEPVWSTISDPAPSAPIMVRLKNRM